MTKSELMRKIQALSFAKTETELYLDCHPENKAALEYVRASAQAEAMKRILPLLDEEENAVFHRGRNIGHTNTPKSATVAEYRAATGMEALFGYLHLAGRKERIDELFSTAYPI